MSYRRTLLIIYCTVLLVLLAACGGSKDTAAAIVEEYQNALVSQNSDLISNLSCEEWEQEAILELDSFQAVDASLEGLNCERVGDDGDVALVLCEGKIIASYNNEKQEIDLNVRTYEVIKVGGDMRVCGYR